MIRKALLGVICSSIIISLKGAVPLADVVNTPSNTVNVTVPSSLNLVFNSDGSNSLDSLSIGNESLVPITIGNISASLYNDWRLVPSDSIISKDTKELSFTIEGKDLASGDNSYSIEIGSRTNKELGVMVKRGAWSNSINEKALNLAINYNIGKSDFTLSFDSSGGSDVENISAKNGDTVVLPIPDKVGYTFLGWKDSNGVIYDRGSSYTMPIGGDKLIAQWRNNTYTIKFDGNGADSGSMDDLVCTYGIGNTLTKNAFIKTGYTFGYWNTKKVVNGKTYWLYINTSDNSVTWFIEDEAPVGYIKHTYGDGHISVSPTSIDGDAITLVANWVPNTYTINFDGNYGTSGSTTSIKATYDSLVNLPSNGFYKSAHTFTGWNTSPYGTGTSYSNNQEVKNLSLKNGDVITLYAQWEPNSISFNFKPENGENDYSLDGVLGDMYDLTVPVKEGYDFNRWDKSDYYGLFGKYVRKHTFEDGILDGIEVYKYGYSDSNLFGKLEMINSSADNPTSSNYEVKITATAPYTVYGLNRYVGFCTRGSITPGKSYVHTFKAKIPKGVKVEAAHNSLGDGGNIYWYTEQYGTGEWETYSYIAELGLNSDSQTVGYIYIDSIDNSVISIPFSWNLASSKIMEVTNVSTDPVLLLGSDNNTLTAKWTPVAYSISYNLDGGTVSNNPSSYNVSNETITLNNPTKTGYTFSGWTESQKPSDWYSGHVDSNGPYEDLNYPDAIHSSPMQVKANRTYYLDDYSKSDNYTIGFRYFSNDGDYLYITDYKDGFEAPKDGIVYILKHSLGDKTTFEEFKKSATLYCNGVNSISKGSIGNRSYTANWKINSYMLDVDAILDGNNITSPYSYIRFDVYINGSLVKENTGDFCTEYEYGTSYEIKNVRSLPGYSYLGPLNGYYLVGTVDAKYNKVYLEMESEIYKISYNLNEGSMSGSLDTYTSNTDTFSLPIPTKLGYTFLGWTGSNGAVPQTNVTISKGSIGDKSYTANWGN